MLHAHVHVVTLTPGLQKLSDDMVIEESCLGKGKKVWFDFNPFKSTSDVDGDPFYLLAGVWHESWHAMSILHISNLCIF